MKVCSVLEHLFLEPNMATGRDEVITNIKYGGLSVQAGGWIPTPLLALSGHHRQGETMGQRLL